LLEDLEDGPGLQVREGVEMIYFKCNHEATPENTYTLKICRKCGNAAKQLLRDKRKAEKESLGIGDGRKAKRTSST
jgi:ribosomal protein L15E